MKPQKFLIFSVVKIKAGKKKGQRVKTKGGRTGGKECEFAHNGARLQICLS